MYMSEMFCNKNIIIVNFPHHFITKSRADALNTVPPEGITDNDTEQNDSNSFLEVGSRQWILVFLKSK